MICGTCKNAIFDALWGDYKCGIKKRNVYDEVSCPEYSKGVPQGSKDDDDYERQMEDEI